MKRYQVTTVMTVPDIEANTVDEAMGIVVKTVGDAFARPITVHSQATIRMPKTFQPNIKIAVEELVYIIEAEQFKLSSRKNIEAIRASRNALKALIGSRTLGKAKAFLDHPQPSERKD